MSTTCNFTKKTEGIINKKFINLAKFDEVSSIMSKDIDDCFLYLIKIADIMNEKNQQFSILINDLTLKRTFLVEQTH